MALILGYVLGGLVSLGAGRIGRNLRDVNSGTDACAALSSILLEGDVLYPNSTLYATENTYWSNQQSEARPACFVTPRSAADVSAVVRALVGLGAAFSVKAGGHTAFRGGSNANGGVTLDLLRMDGVVVSDDRQTVAVGPGARWIRVAEVLDPLGLAVVGGRVADVGVSGLLLGGGISYFSGEHGWACDNVRSYEVVLSSGAMVNATPTTHADLYWALRGGGGSNFGVVTRFDLAAFPQGDLWSDDVVWPAAVGPELIARLTNLTVWGLPADPRAHAYLVRTHAPALGGSVWLASLYYTSPPTTPAVGSAAANVTPAVFAPLRTVPGALSDAVAVTNVSARLLAIDAGEPYGARQTWWDTSVAVTSPTLLADVVPFFEDLASELLSAAAASSAVTPFLVYQPIPVNVLTAMQKNGGNALGLGPGDGPLMLVQLSVTWEDAGLDEVVEDGARRFIERVEALAAEREELKGFVYMNYAGMHQDPLRRYGRESYERLREVAKTYDPDGLLQKHWNGYFQLDGLKNR